MSGVLTHVPWGNLWRWVVSTLLFSVIFGMPIAILTSLDEGPLAPVFQLVIIVLGAVIAAIVVWSDDVPWPGDT